MAAVDLNAERRKQLQKEIAELEKNLDPGGATLIEVLSDCSLGSDSESDDLADTDLDLDFHMDEGTEDDNEDLEKNLPENPETCLQINLVYQEVIEEKIREVELLLAQNKEEQEELMWELAGYKGLKSQNKESPRANLYLGHFLKPYFKDKATGIGPPANEDTKEKKAQGIKSFEELSRRKWKNEEKTLLKNSVVSDSLQHMLQPKLFKLDYLNQKLGGAKSAMENQTLTKQIKETEREIEDMNLITEEILVGKRTDEHDWEKIANINFDGTRKPEQIRKFWQNSEHPSINKKPWSKEEVEKLREIAEKHNLVDWQTIAGNSGTNRTAFQCLQKYQGYNKDFKRKEFTKEEDHMLLQLVQEMRVGNFIPYKKMAYYMEGRDSMQLLHRWTKSVDPSLKKGSWTPEEDALLLKAVAKFGERDWYKIRTEVPGRSDSQCRDRYLKGISQGLKKGKWSPEEEAKFIELLEKYGVGHWAKIASELPGRTDSQCLSKWKFMLGYQKKSSFIKGWRKHRSRKKPGSSSSDVTSNSSDNEDTEKSETSSDEEIETYKNLRKARYILPSMDLWVPTKATSAVLQKASMRHTISKGSFGPDRPSVQGSTESGPSKPASEVRDPPTQALLETNTVLKGISSCHSTVSTEDTAELLKTVSKSGKKALKVTLDDVKKILRRNTRLQKKKFRKQSNRSRVSKSSRMALNIQVGPEPIMQYHGLERECQKKKRVSQKNTINRRLLMAVTPWVGNVILPYSLSRARPLGHRTQADKIRDQLQSVNLISSPVFVLLIWLFKIDGVGCLKVIQERKVKQAALLRSFASSVGHQQTSCSSQKTSDSTVQNYSQQSISVPQENMSKQSETQPGIQTAKWASLPAAQPCARNSYLPREKPKTVLELLREKRSRESMDKTSKEKGVILKPQMLVFQQVTQQGAGQPTTPISSRPAKRLLPALPQVPCSSTALMPLQNGMTAAQASASPSSTMVNNVQPSGNSGGKALESSSPVSGMAPHQGSASVQMPGNGAVSSPCQNPAQASGQILAAPPLDIKFPLKIALGEQEALKDKSQVTPIQSQQKTPICLLPTLVTAQGGPGSAPDIMLPITWVLTPQGLIPLSLRKVVGLPSHNEMEAKAVTGASSPSNNKSLPMSSNIEQSAVSVLPVSTVKPSVSSPGTSNDAHASNLSVQEGSAHSSLPLLVTSFNANGSSAGELPSSLISVPSSGTSTVQSAVSLNAPLLCARPELPSADSTRDTSEEVFAVPGQNTTPTDCVAQKPHHLSATPSVSERVKQPDHSVREMTETAPEAVQHPHIPPNPAHSNVVDPLDFSLVSLEEDEKVKKWLKGEQGVQLPMLINPLPYLPPSVCSLKMLSRLLLQKKALEQRTTSLLPPTEENQMRNFEQKLQVIRGMVEQRLKDNPAYIQLKVRFLATFTFPAFLATLTPPRGKTTIPHNNRRFASTDDSDTEGTAEEPKATESNSNEIGNDVAEIHLDSTVEHQPVVFSTPALYKVEIREDPHSSEAIVYPVDTSDNVSLQSRRSVRLRKRKCQN
uniref:snRNA-activating protein complex subunit 4 n=1 Tax=Geotrypetes seraphini TaxID=260995 RepID=A0A6P8SD39_GEOSA|nr:snRNA-activating protein complex subunit 4 [Geotrypetes seraphini]